MKHNTANRMEAIQEDGDEYSLSGISFPSLDRMHFQEEHGIPPGDATTSGDEIEGIHMNNMDGRNSDNRADMNETSSQFISYDDHDDDGYPTDEHTAPSFSQLKEKEQKRQNILQLARNRLAKKEADDIPKEVSNTPEPAADDDSFLGNADAVDVENAPDDSSFLVDAGMDDVPDDFASIRSEHGTVDTYYDIHASTLSRASASTKASTIGDQILLESNMAAQMKNKSSTIPDADCQSASTYSYRRAYVDNVTLGSNYTSTCSALTDDYCFDARRTGMSEAIKAKNIQEDHPYHEDIKRAPSGPIDSDTGDILAQPSDCSHDESLARPPPPRFNEPAVYENPEHLTTIVSFGEGEGYVDEEAARKYAALERNNGDGCCGWFTSSSRLVKLILLCSVLLCLISLASVALALLLPREEIVRTETSTKSSANVNVTDQKVTQEDLTSGNVDAIQGDAAPSLGPTASLTPAQSKTSSSANTASPTNTHSAPIKCEAGVQCFSEGSRCTDGRTESCCGETYDSFVCNCSDVNGKLEYMCFFTDACFAPSCEILEPSVSTTSPTHSPSKSPEKLIYTTSSITDAPTKQPSVAPTFEPSKRPTQLPTQLPTPLPTQKPSNNPTARPSPVPTDKPTLQPTVRPTTIPTDKPIITDPTPTQELMQTVTLKAAKDTYVNASSPVSNYGTFTRLRVDGSPRVWSIISFDTSEVNSIAQNQRRDDRGRENEPRRMQAVQVVEAKLRVFTLDAGSGAIFCTFPNGIHWEEKKLSWNTMRQIDRSGEFQLGSMNWVNSFQWYEIDVTAAFEDYFSTDGVQNFLIKSDSRNGVAFASRERNSGSHSPELVLTFTSGTGNGMAAPIVTPTIPAPSPWPTYSPSSLYSETTNPPTPKPSRQPSKRPTIKPFMKPSQPPSKRPSKNPTAEPTKLPTLNPSIHPTTPEPTRLPTRKPSRRPSTRAPHKRPFSRTHQPTISPVPTYNPTVFTIVKNHIIGPSLSPTSMRTSPSTLSGSVPPGCVPGNDIHLTLQQVLLSSQRKYNSRVVFPSRDGYIRGGIYSGENYGLSDSLILDTASKVLIEFDLGLIAVTSSIYNILSVTLRLFVDSVDDTTSLSIFKLPQSVQWDEDQVTWDNFGTPSLEKVGPAIEVKSSDRSKWIDVDVTNFIGGHQVDKFVLAMDNSEGSGRCAIASRKTCLSPKLVVVSEEPI